MSCGEYVGGLIEWARSRPVEAAEQQTLAIHVEACAACAQFLDEQRALHRFLERLAAEELPVEDRIEARVLAEFDTALAPRWPAKLSAARWILAAGLAASVSLGALWTLRRAPVESQAAARPEGTPFLTIPYTIPLSPGERAEVVRMRIPVTALLAAGFHVQVSDPSDAIDADVLVSQDGRARAIRPLTISMSN